MTKTTSGGQSRPRNLSDRIFPWREKIADLRSEMAGLRSEIDGLHSEITGFRSEIDRLRGEIAAIAADRKEEQFIAELDAARDREAAFAESCKTRFHEMAQRRFALEQLLTSSPAARPPGARAAVARLGDPAVSVILPTYNRARFLGEAIASVQAQSFSAWELWVVDDGSSDDTETAVNDFLADRRVHYVRKENGGSSSARNEGLRLSSAPLIAYIDSDNVWYPDFLAAAVDHFATHSDDDFLYGALVSHIHNLDSSCILWREFDRADLENDNYIDTNVLMHRASVVEKYGAWDTRLSCLNDWDVALRYTADKPPRALNVLAAYYRRCDDIRATDSGGQPAEREIILAKLAKRRADAAAAAS
jgi:hypothetical protein